MTKQNNLEDLVGETVTKVFIDEYFMECLLFSNGKVVTGGEMGSLIVKDEKDVEYNDKDNTTND